ncbi:hypothetical protein A3SI_15870 [Nitritalea halalkaliphila LW7]|uniref:Uncharacterized protein n=1 Tax=Nitritalea halalkaliphila LW7 TaxID=1189621 RepID=I5BY38_9BACT|nr:hypothetical protein [Nitritalea halalkaliphila]EIM74490.1 hypothetical protein A3SI_15870 [Nitritalea halalkaliphila LW7]
MRDPFQGRSDKKFCDDNCRNIYNNRRKNKEDKELQVVLRIIRKNRKILQKWHEVKKGDNFVIPRDALLLDGFDFNYFTGVEKVVSEQERFVYYNVDYAYWVQNEKSVEVRFMKKGRESHAA